MRILGLIQKFFPIVNLFMDVCIYTCPRAIPSKDLNHLAPIYKIPSKDLNHLIPIYKNPFKDLNHLALIYKIPFKRLNHLTTIYPLLFLAILDS